MTFAVRFAVWRTVMNTANLPEGMTRPPDAISKWLVITRAAVFSMTATSGVIGGLLAIGAARLTGEVTVDRLCPSPVLSDSGRHGGEQHDQRLLRPGGGRRHRRVRPRALRAAPDPVRLGHEAPVGAAILIANAIDLAIHAFPRVEHRGPLVIAFALAGLFVSVFYVAPPIRLKHIGLGEPGVFVVWGPLMVGGTFFVATGELPGWVWLASLPYAILVTTVLFGKHIDKIEADAAKRIRTLPVILGEAARPPRRTGPHGRLLPDRPRRRPRRIHRSVGGARRARHPAQQ